MLSHSLTQGERWMRRRSVTEGLRRIGPLLVSPSKVLDQLTAVFLLGKAMGLRHRKGLDH